MQPTAVDFGRVSIGSAARSGLTLIEEEIRDLQYQIDRAMYAHIEKGTFTGEIAMMAFARKHALYQVLTRLHQKDTTGQNAAKRLVAHPQEI